jgi:3-deoxy-D-arabino-heptulosonate 7-phosphate (DAHP) synthase
MKKRKQTTSTQTRLGLLLTRLCLSDKQMRKVAMMAAPVAADVNRMGMRREMIAIDKMRKVAMTAAVADVNQMGARRQKMAMFFNEADARKMKVAGPGAHTSLHEKMAAPNKAENLLKARVKKM